MNVSINRNQLKYIAIIAMLIDHIAWAFVPMETILGQGMHFVGRLTGPIMAYMLYEGYIHTRNVKKYATRLGIFALVSWVPFSLFEYGDWPEPQFGVIFTLFLALLVLWMWDKSSFKKPLKVVLVVGACFVSIFGDWPVFDIIWPLFLFIYHDDEKKKWKTFTLLILLEIVLMVLMQAVSDQSFSSYFQLGVLMVPPILSKLYNGEPGSRHPIHKWFFYIFYPAHLLVLALLKMVL
ncbi:MAG: hypothetical protein IJT04_07695 [Bacteroidales bacterium]|nr:hypothetical protein [Bacteroidales bacterium]